MASSKKTKTPVLDERTEALKTCIWYTLQDHVGHDDSPEDISETLTEYLDENESSFDEEVCLEVSKLIARARDIDLEGESAEGEELKRCNTESEELLDEALQLLLAVKVDE